MEFDEIPVVLYIYSKHKYSMGRMRWWMMFEGMATRALSNERQRLKRVPGLMSGKEWQTITSGLV